jgi:hypothetical protein
MNAAAAETARQQTRALTIAILGTLALLALWFIGTRALPYADFSLAAYGATFGRVVGDWEWMLRRHTVTFAFVIFRLFSDGLGKLGFASYDDIGAIMAWACWAVPLMLVEPLIQVRKIRG